MNYTGIAFPFSFGASGGVAQSSTSTEDIPHIFEAIEQLLATRNGERENEDYGSELHKLAFSNGDDIELAEACMYVRDAIATFEPRVKVLDVSASYDPDSSSILIDLSIKYKVTGASFNKTLSINENGGTSWIN